MHKVTLMSRQLDLKTASTVDRNEAVL